MIINKDSFLKWQEQIINEYYTDKHLKTDLFPKKNKPAVQNDKWISRVNTNINKYNLLNEYSTY